MQGASEGNEVTPSDWAVLILEDNVITSNAFPANVAGTSYRIDFMVSAAVYADVSQAMLAGDESFAEVPHAGNSVLASTKALPGAWTGKMTFTPVNLDYKGDGSGDVRLRISPANPRKSGRFHGAIDTLRVRMGGKYRWGW